MMAHVVETSVTNNSPSQDSNHPHDNFQSSFVISMLSKKVFIHLDVGKKNKAASDSDTISK